MDQVKSSIFGNRLRKLRMEAGKSFDVVAKGTGIPKTSLINWEVYGVSPSLENVVKICKYFKISADYLVGLDDGSKLTPVAKEYGQKIEALNRRTRNLTLLVIDAITEKVNSYRRQNKYYDPEFLNSLVAEDEID